jgi:hypothetical protein
MVLVDSAISTIDRGSDSWRKSKKTRGLNVKIRTCLKGFILVGGYCCEKKKPGV